MRTSIPEVVVRFPLFFSYIAASSDFRQTGDQRVGFSVFGVAGDPSSGMRKKETHGDFYHVSDDLTLAEAADMLNRKLVVADRH